MEAGGIRSNERRLLRCTVRLGRAGRSSGHFLVLWNGKLSVGGAGEGEEYWIFAKGSEYGVDAGFHHFFSTHGSVALVLKEVALQQVERLLFLAKLRVDGGEIVGGGKQGFVFLRDSQGLVAMPVARKESGGENEIEGIGRIELQGFTRVVVGLRRVPFGIPVNGEIAVGEGKRIFTD